jgi:hypothetical protein
MPRLLARTFRALVWTVAVALVLELTLIKAPMALTRWRMRHLLADFHSIYPTQSTWSDAQRIIARWQHWGYSRGSCSQTDCDYQIEISDPLTRLVTKWPERFWGDRYSRFIRELGRTGWRDSDMSLRFIVQDNRIVRTETYLNIEVSDSGPPDHYDYVLMLATQVRSRLRRAESIEEQHERWILGNDEQLGDHPDYKMGRPGGCEGCESVELTYVPSLSHSTLVRLTDYDLSCLTRFRACTAPYDVLPAVRELHFYDPEPATLPAAPAACRTEPRALARDADVVLEVEPISVEKKLDTSWTDVPIAIEGAHVRLLRVLKGVLHGQTSDNLVIEPYSGVIDAYTRESPEHLVPGRRAFVFLHTSSGFEPDGHFEAERCGVIDDTPANLSAIETGIAQDIPVRHPITHW